MSKKKKAVSALISSFLGEETIQNIKTDLPEASIAELGISPDLVEALNKERTKNVGRPRKDLRTAKEYGCMVGDTRATFVLKKELITKLKYISLMETRTLKSILTEVLGGFVAGWEEKNGNINLKKPEQ